MVNATDKKEEFGKRSLWTVLRKENRLALRRSSCDLDHDNHKSSRTNTVSSQLYPTTLLLIIKNFEFVFADMYRFFFGNMKYTRRHS